MIPARASSLFVHGEFGSALFASDLDLDQFSKKGSTRFAAARKLMNKITQLDSLGRRRNHHFSSHSIARRARATKISGSARAPLARCRGRATNNSHRRPLNSPRIAQNKCFAISSGQAAIKKALVILIGRRCSPLVERVSSCSALAGACVRRARAASKLDNN